MIFFYLLPLCICCSLTAAEILDHEMSGAERKKTGVSKLSDKEKALLQKWIDTYYEKRGAPIFQEIEDRHAVLQENLLNGQLIRLSDETLWEIFADDIPIAQGWITPVEIIVACRGEADYPYRLTNSLTGSCLRARKKTLQPSKIPS
jgi:hypothetical protein